MLICHLGRTPVTFEDIPVPPLTPEVESRLRSLMDEVAGRVGEQFSAVKAALVREITIERMAYTVGHRHAIDCSCLMGAVGDDRLYHRLRADCFWMAAVMVAVGRPLDDVLMS